MRNLTSAMNKHLTLKRSKHIKKLDKIVTKINIALATPTDTQSIIM